MMLLRSLAKHSLSLQAQVGALNSMLQKEEVSLDKVVNCQLALKNPNGYLLTMKPVLTAMKLLEGESDFCIDILIPRRGVSK